MKSNKLPILNQPTFDETLSLLTQAHLSSLHTPIKGIKKLPQMAGIHSPDKKFLKIKALKYIIFHDKEKRIWKGFLQNPLVHSLRYLHSFFKKNTFSRNGDFFFYGIPDENVFCRLAKKKKLLLGFSYCQKPHECPAGRFNDRCFFHATNSICKQCDIFKIRSLFPKNSECTIIPTVHDIGSTFFTYLKKEKTTPLFIITACEMTLTMFADFGNMLAIQGIGIRLDGRICNTMKAFELSEQGIKPGLTLLTTTTYQRVLDLCKRLNSQ